MSSLEFTATLFIDGTHPARGVLSQLAKLRSNVDPIHCKEALANLEAGGIDGELIALCTRHSVAMKAEDDSLWLQLQTGSDTPLERFGKFQDLFECLGVEHYHARLFDSSSGGIQIWEKPEQAVDFSDAKVYLLGQFDEDDEVNEKLEELGAELVDDLDDSTLVIVGVNPDPGLLHSAKIKGIPIITEEKMWDSTFW